MKRDNPRWSTAISMLVDQENRPVEGQALTGVVDVLRWHRCAYEVEHHLYRGSQRAKGEQ
jgi:hypothetical protein